MFKEILAVYSETHKIHKYKTRDKAQNLLGCIALFLIECRTTFQRYVMPPCTIITPMEVARTSETSVDIQLRTRQYIPEDSEIHTRRRENLKSHKTRFTDCYKRWYIQLPLNFKRLNISVCASITHTYIKQAFTSAEVENE
jgi:hypothetical protein